MERADLLNANAEILSLTPCAQRSRFARLRVPVVGNPCTQCLIAMKSARISSSKTSISMLRLDQNRLMAQTATQAKVSVNDITHAAVWATYLGDVPDLDHAIIGRLRSNSSTQPFYQETMTLIVAKRGSAIIEARGASSAAPAASAAIDHIRDWVLGSGDRWVTMGVPPTVLTAFLRGSSGSPARRRTAAGKSFRDLNSGLACATIAKSVAELESERAHVAALLGRGLTAKDSEIAAGRLESSSLRSLLFRPIRPKPFLFF